MTVMAVVAKVAEVGHKETRRGRGVMVEEVAVAAEVVNEDNGGMKGSNG